MNTFLDLHDAEFRQAYVEEAAVADVQYEICRLMAEQGVSRAELARRLGVSAPYVTQMLSDEDANMTIKTIARVFDALGVSLSITSAAPSFAKIACEDEDLPDWRDLAANSKWEHSVAEDSPAPGEGCAVYWLDAVRRKAA